MSTRIKPSRASNVGPTLFGPQTSSAITPRSVSATLPSAANPVAPKSATASADLLRARHLLREVLIREDVTEEELLLDEVRDGLDQVCRILEYLAGQQQLFEFWRVEMKK
jgi:hypothetical protein